MQQSIRVSSTSRFGREPKHELYNLKCRLLSKAGSRCGLSHPTRALPWAVIFRPGRLFNQRASAVETILRGSRGSRFEICFDFSPRPSPRKLIGRIGNLIRKIRRPGFTAYTNRGDCQRLARIVAGEFLANHETQFDQVVRHPVLK